MLALEDDKLKSPEHLSMPQPGWDMHRVHGEIRIRVLGGKPE